MSEKICGTCKKSKPENEFWRGQSRCIVCLKAARYGDSRNRNAVTFSQQWLSKPIVVAV